MLPTPKSICGHGDGAQKEICIDFLSGTQRYMKECFFSDIASDINNIISDPSQYTFRK